MKALLNQIPKPRAKNQNVRVRLLVNRNEQLQINHSTNMTTLSLNKVNLVYFDKLFVDKNNTALSAAIKAKVLLVDHHTMPIISMSHTQSQLLQHDVILIEMLENNHNLTTMKHLNCIVYIKPIRESIAMLCQELSSPHYHHYQIFFSNTVSKSDLEKMAQADEFEVINQVMEIFLDYSIVNDNLFTISLSNDITSPKHTATILESNSLLSLLLSLKKTPVIKYETTSIESKKLASEILYYINSNSNNNLFDDLNRKSDMPPVLLLLDRKSDPLTPLVTPWTYQSMIHELIGIDRNIVNLKDSSEQLTLSETMDVFYLESMYLNYGDLTDKFQKYVDEYKKQTKQSSIENLKTQDLSELKKILTKFPEFKKLSNNILKHLNIISEIDKQISSQNLWAVGELQQTIVCELESHQSIKTKLMDLIADPHISTENKVKVLILYVAKFPNNHSDLSALLAKLNDPITTTPPPTISQQSLIRNFGKYFGRAKKVQAPVNNNDTNIGKMFNTNRIKIQQLFNTNSNAHGNNMPKTDNIFMQYIPRLNDILTLITTNPLQSQQNSSPSNDIATLVPDVVSNQYGKTNGIPAQEVIVYFKGGATYEEARLIHDLSVMNPRVKYIIGGDGVLNSKQWLENMCDIVNGATEGDSLQTDRRAQLREIL